MLDNKNLYNRKPSSILKRTFSNVASYLKPYGHLAVYAVSLLAFYAFIRILGVAVYHDVIDMAEVPRLFFNGMRVDISGLGYILALPVLLAFIRCVSPKSVGIPVLIAERLYLLLLGILVIFMELCTLPFMEEYACRPNRIFLEYLLYPSEVTGLLLKGHLAAVVVVNLLMIFVFIFLLRCLKKIEYVKVPVKSTVFAVFILVGGLTFVAARSSFDHRPFNLAKASFSTNQIVNALVANSGYSLASSVKSMLAEKSVSYKMLQEDEIISIIRDDTGFDYSVATDKQPTLNSLVASEKGARKNIVIILEESLGAEYVGYLNGSNLTPNLDKIYSEGWGFINMYSTGTRSVRGIEAVTAGFTPTVNTSTVKREKAQKNFFNMASVLKKNGYHSSFIYGGESHFDNMRAFFLGNDYTQVIDLNDFSNPMYVGSWGASDEDLFNKALEHFDEMNSKGQPFYSLVFTSSNHDPFDIVESFAGKVRNRETAVRYADYALGKFYEEVKSRPYFKDTVFLVIADHDSRAWGNELIPVKHFHIPAVFFGGGIEHKSEFHVVSQIDVPKTLLSLAGISATVPTVGYDLTNLPSGFDGRAILQFYNNFAYLKDDGTLVMVLPDEKVSFCKYDFENRSVSDGMVNEKLEKTALAYALLGEIAYRKGFFLMK